MLVLRPQTRMFGPPVSPLTVMMRLLVRLTMRTQLCMLALLLAGQLPLKTVSEL